ncbi:MAG: hypothetical protein AAF416_18735 [Pseudomonadota bacterium]
MTRTDILSIVTAAALSLTAETAHARNGVIALAKQETTEQQLASAREIARYLAQTVEPGESMHLLDAKDGRIIATFSVPDRAAYANPKAKLSANRAAMQALLTFAEQPAASVEEIGRADYPSLLRVVGTRYPTDDEADLIIVADPRQHDPRRPSLSMVVRDQVPNYGHVMATRAHSDYGLAGLEGWLEGYAIHYGGLGTDWAVTAQHAHFVEHYVAVSAAHVGAALATFEGDLATLLAQAATGRPMPADQPVLQPTDKLEMIQFYAEGAALASIYDRPLTTSPAHAAELRRAEEVEVGIRWDNCDACDLDLYARPSVHAPVIFYGNAETREGLLQKDFRHSPALTRGYETIAFHGPVDLAALRLGISFYAGSASGGPTGEIRVAIGARTWEARFHIPATEGNGGTGREAAMETGRAPNAAWVMIDPVAVVTGR